MLLQKYSCLQKEQEIGDLAAFPNLNLSESLLSQKVSDLNVVLAFFIDNVNIDREVRIHKSHFVLESDSDTLHQVRDQRLHSSERSNVLSVTVVDANLNLGARELGKSHINVTEIFLQLSARTLHKDLTGFDDDLDVFWDIKNFRGLDVLHGDIIKTCEKFSGIWLFFKSDSFSKLPSSRTKKIVFELFLTSMFQALQQQARRFHTSRMALALSKQKRKELASHKKKQNLVLQAGKLLNKEKVDPVLGRPNNPFIQRLRMEIEEPTVLAKRFDLAEVDKLLFGAKESKILKSVSTLGYDENTVKQIEQEESEKREILLRILSLRNADQAEKNKRIQMLAIAEFARFEGDTGSSEVQAASLTVELYNLMNHIKQNPQDKVTVRDARLLTQKRQKLLRYLKRDQPQRYYWTIEKLGLTDEVVQMEFNFDKKYMQDFEIWPGRQLVRPGKRENIEKLRLKRLLTKERLAELKKRESVKADDLTREEINSVAGYPTTTTATPLSYIILLKAGIFGGAYNNNGITGESSTPYTMNPSRFNPKRRYLELNAILCNLSFPSSPLSSPIRTRNEVLI
ncbi:hypothetical protein OGAPHI_002189 [Ogataea philodendri]|uniref:Uncharacterized protein n=1 Tax=Ogataea philodendri TaxID=1378263 RepID=A0A9P8T7Q9_9ASCO|nr:uncharacterized protein OGAPHI_002189 [Ogataea philodendri]KAH3668435.1 hypothetical protein OGAPHI_002189 [Ogataea philodendri]